jgi:hypothetical protein
VTAHRSVLTTRSRQIHMRTSFSGVKCLLYRASASVLANQSRPGSANRWEAAFASAFANAPPVDGWRGCKGIA